MIFKIGIICIFIAWTLLLFFGSKWFEVDNVIDVIGGIIFFIGICLIVISFLIAAYRYLP